MWLWIIIVWPKRAVTSTCSDIDYRPGPEINLVLRHQHFLVIQPLLLSPGAYTQYSAYIFYSRFASVFSFRLSRTCRDRWMSGVWVLHLVVVMQMNRSVRFLSDARPTIELCPGHKKVRCLIASTPISSRAVEQTNNKRRTHVCR